MTCLFICYLADLMLSVLRLPPLLRREELPCELMGVEGGRAPACFLVGVFLLPLLVKEVLLPRGLIPVEESKINGEYNCQFVKHEYYGTLHTNYSV